MADPFHPLVPQVAGVPAINRIGQALGQISILSSDLREVLGLFGGTVWGIFDQSGNPIIVGDSVKVVDFWDDWRISDYPVEQGSFASYNKVALPFRFKMTFIKTGMVTDRQEFLISVQAALQGLDILQAVTAEVVYPSVNVAHYDYRRDYRNANIVYVDVWCYEIRVAPAPQFSQENTKSPSGADPINNGPVQLGLPAAIGALL